MDNRELMENENERTVFVGEKKYVFYINEEGCLLVTIEDKEDCRTVVVDRELSVFGSIYADMIIEKGGCILFCSDPATGLMRKMLYITKDDWNTVFMRVDLSSDISGYPTGIVNIENSEYFITTLYHGDHVYLYHSVDGKQWEPFALEIPGDGILYVDGESIRREEEQFEINIKVVRENGAERVRYTSKDGIIWEQE